MIFINKYSLSTCVLLLKAVHINLIRNKLISLEERPVVFLLFNVNSHSGHCSFLPPQRGFPIHQSI